MGIINLAEGLEHKQLEKLIAWDFKNLKRVMEKI